MSLIAQEWLYLNEGNMHIILRYQGNQIYFIDKILRLQKKNISENIQLQENKCLDQRIQQIESQLNKGFMNYLRKQSKHFVMSEELTEISADEKQTFLKEICTKIEDMRPQNRKQKGIDFDTPFLIEKNINKRFQTQATGKNYFLIEIKPKSGSYDKYDKNQLNHLNDLNLLNLHFQLENKIDNTKNFKKKLQQNEITDYNSVEFFDELKRLDVLNTQIKNKNKFFKVIGESNNEVICKILKKEKQLIQLILKLQQLYDKPIQQIKCDYEELKQEIEKGVDIIGSQLIEERIKKIVENGASNKLEEVLSVLIQGSMNDLSIIMNVERDESVAIEEMEGERVCWGGSVYSYQLGVIDLQLKPFAKLSFWIAEHFLLFQAYIQHLTSLK